MKLVTHKSKNLFDYHKASKILGSATLSKQSDFILIATQTHKNSYTSVAVELDKSFVGKTVTLSALAKTSSINNPNLRIQWFKSDGLATGNLIETKNTSASSDFIQISVTGTVPENPGDGDYLCLCFYSNKDIDLSSSTESSFSATYKNIQLEIGTEVTTYQPHTWNLLNKWQYSATQTVNGVVITNNNDGSYTFDGTATDNSYFNYYVLGKDLRGGVVDGSISNGYYAKDVTYDYSNGIAYYYFSKDTIFNNTLIIPQLYDLTLMYGAGKEPTTVDQFYTDHPELKVSPLGFIGLKNLEISNKNIKRLRYKTADGALDLGIIPSNSGYILNKYNNLSEELLEENIEKDTVNYHIPDKTNILLNKVEGNTKKVVQLLDKSKYGTSWNHDGINWTPYGAYGIIHCVGKNTGTQYNAFMLNDSWDMNDIVFDDHKYILLTGLKQTYPSFEAGWFCGYSDEDGTTGYEWYSSTGIDQTNLNVFTIKKHNYTWKRIELRVSYGNEDTLDVWWTPQLFDLTAMYGRGNEPTTLEQFKKDYPQFFDEKLDGIWNVRTSGISTTGKNIYGLEDFIKKNNASDMIVTYDGKRCFKISRAFNPTYYFPLGNYSLNFKFYSTYEYSFCQYGKYENGNYTIKQFVGSFTSGNWENAHYNFTDCNFIKWYNEVPSDKVLYVDINSFSLSAGIDDTNSYTYQENKIDLLSTQTLNGINGVNDSIEVIDKGNGLYDLKKTQNIDSVDLGTLDWVVDGSNFSSSSISSVIKTPTNDSVGNYVCQKYVNCAINKSFVDGDFGVNSSGYLYFRNSAYTTATAFKTAVNGVILYYQLKTPVITTIATNLTYNQVSAIRTNGGLLLVNDNNNQKYVLPDVIMKENYQYKN